MLRSACAIALAAAPVFAQSDAPGVFISPAGGTFTTASQTVSVTWSHDFGLVQSSHWIKLNGVQVGTTYQARSTSPGGGVLYARSDAAVTLVAGANTVEARICSSTACTTESATLTYTPPPPPAQRAPARISLATHYSRYQDQTHHGSTLSYTTPAYVSLGQPRSLTLLYTSESAVPRPFLQVELTDPSLDPADVVSLEIADSTGARRALTNSGTISYWRNTGGITGDTLRLGAQWPINTAGASAAKSIVIVRSYWELPGGSTHVEETTDTIRMPVVNRSASPYGAGWMVAGVQQLYPTSNGVVVDEGTGGASWFPVASTGGYASPAGDASTLSYNGGSTTYRRTWPDGSGIVFNALGYPQYRYTLLGDTTRYAFTGNRLTSVTDPAGKAFQLYYDASNKLQRIVDPQGRTAWITISGGRVTQILDYDGVPALGNITYYLHTGGASTNQLFGWTDRAGGQWEVAYSSFGMLTGLTAPQVTLASGSAARPRTTFTTEKTRVLTGRATFPTLAQAPRVRPDSVYSTVTDARGNTTRVWTDRFGLPLRIIGPVADTTVIQRDTAGRATSVRGPNGNVVHAQYTAQGQVARSFDEGRGVQTDYSYATQGGGTFLSRTSEGAEDLHYDRGSRGEVLTVRRGTDPTPVMTYRYDARMRVDTIVDAGGHVTAFFYDGNAALNVDSVRNVTSAGNQRTAYTYDVHGRTATVTGPQNTVTSIAYDSLNRTRKARAPGDSVMYGYFGGDSVVVTDAAGKRFVTRYNALGWTVWERDPQGRLTSAAYDSAGNVVQLTDRHGRVFTHAYDAAGRDTSFTAPGVGTTRYGFDPRGRWTWVQNAESLDTLFVTTGASAGRASLMGGQRFEVGTLSDGQGRKTAVTVVGGPAGAVWTSATEYEYDARGRLAQMRDLDGHWTQVRYNAEDLPDTLVYPNGTTVRMGYTPRHALLQTEYSAPALNTAFGASELAYNILDNLTSRTNANETRRREYDYDGQGRLNGFRDNKQVQLPLPPECGGSSTTEGCDPMFWWSTMRQQGFAYDAVGNRSTVTYDDSASAPVSWSATLQAASNRYATYGGWTLEHDSVGNLVRRHNGTRDIRYGWNSLGQLAWVAPTAGDTIRYFYNGLGERVRRLQGGTSTRFIYDGDDLAAEVDANGSRIRAYAYWPGIDQPHSMRTWEGGQNGATYYYALDLPTNNVQGLFGTANGVATRYDYSPFGEAYTSAGTVGNPLRFAGRELDASAGLYYVRARWYDPHLGRFISEDPIGLAGGINNYAYAINDPVNMSDPSGLDPCRPGQVNRANEMRCGATFRMDELIVVSAGWWSSMLDQVMTLLGPPNNGGVERALVNLADGSLRAYKGEVEKGCGQNVKELALDALFTYLGGKTLGVFAQGARARATGQAAGELARRAAAEGTGEWLVAAEALAGRGSHHATMLWAAAGVTVAKGSQADWGNYARGSGQAYYEAAKWSPVGIGLSGLETLNACGAALFGG